MGASKSINFVISSPLKGFGYLWSILNQIKNGEGGIRSRRTWQAVATDGRTFLKKPNLLTTLLTTNFLTPWQSLAISGNQWQNFSSGISRSQRFWQLLATPEYKRKRRGSPLVANHKERQRKGMN